MPPPGVYALEYLIDYRASQLNDNQGDKIPFDFDLKHDPCKVHCAFVRAGRRLAGEVIHLPVAIAPGPKPVTSSLRRETGPDARFPIEWRLRWTRDGRGPGLLQG